MIPSVGPGRAPCSADQGHADLAAVRPGPERYEMVTPRTGLEKRLP